MAIAVCKISHFYWNKQEKEGKMFLKVQNYKKNAQLFGYLEKKSYLCTNRGVEQLVARQAHNLEVARSNPASATRTRMCRVCHILFFFDNNLEESENLCTFVVELLTL